MVVLAISSLMVGVVSLSVLGINTEGSLNEGVTSLAQTLREARAYAISKNTYAFVGISEVDGVSFPGTVPQPAGNGRVAAVILTTIDKSYGLSANFTPSNVIIVEPAATYQGLHFTSGMVFQGKPTSAMTQNISPAQMPVFTSGTPLTWPLTGTSKFTFGTVVQFNPMGGAQLLGGTYDPSIFVPLEIDVQPAHGDVVNTNAQSTTGAAVIIADGPSGLSTIYRP